MFIYNLYKVPYHFVKLWYTLLDVMVYILVIWIMQVSDSINEPFFQLTLFNVKV